MSAGVTSTTEGAVPAVSAITYPVLVLDRREPGFIFRIPAIDGIEEKRLQLLGDGTAFAVADRAVVELANWRHLGGGASKEGLGGYVHIIARPALRLDFDPKIVGECNHRIAGDADQGRGELRLVELAVLDHKEIFAGALGDEAV